jgi:hypothetical protein
VPRMFDRRASNQALRPSRAPARLGPYNTMQLLWPVHARKNVVQQKGAGKERIPRAPHRSNSFKAFGAASGSSSMCACASPSETSEWQSCRFCISCKQRIHGPMPNGRGRSSSRRARCNLVTPFRNADIPRLRLRTGACAQVHLHRGYVCTYVTAVLLARGGTCCCQAAGRRVIALFSSSSSARRARWPAPRCCTPTVDASMDVCLSCRRMRPSHGPWCYGALVF